MAPFVVLPGRSFTADVQKLMRGISITQYFISFSKTGPLTIMALSVLVRLAGPRPPGVCLFSFFFSESRVLGDRYSLLHSAFVQGLVVQTHFTH